MGLTTGCSEGAGKAKVTGVDVLCVGADDICEDKVWLVFGQMIFV